MIDVEGVTVNWERRFTLNNVYVLELGPSPPRDLFVAWTDWRFSIRTDTTPSTPLGNLAQLISAGAKFIASPRAPIVGVKEATVKYITLPQLTEKQRQETIATMVEPTKTAGALNSAASTSRSTSASSRVPTAAATSVPPSETKTLEERIYDRIPLERRTPEAARLVAGLMSRRKVFGDIDTSECTQTIEFTILPGEKPREVSFQVKASRKAGPEIYREVLGSWEEKGIIESVPIDTPSYGFAILVPKPGGKFRMCISPTGLNDYTERTDPDGGYMPADMIREAQKAGNRKFAVSIDLREAFLTFVLGPLARKLSTFTTPVGRYRWRHGWFGYHSFPSLFQIMIMTKVILPTAEQYGDLVSLLCWIDDIIVSGDTETAVIDATLSLIDRILAIGGRISLEKCIFLDTKYKWCGVEVDLMTQQWRVAPDRVA